MCWQLRRQLRVSIKNDHKTGWVGGTEEMKVVAAHANSQTLFRLRRAASIKRKPQEQL